tara:strand:- start:67 stop:255 length:189 start_codon:yes stop_codon:yes gene_type:complete
MKTILVILTALTLTACSVKEPRLTFGKKCTVKDDKIVYSYLWIYDKSAGVPADAITCELLDK